MRARRAEKDTLPQVGEARGPAWFSEALRNRREGRETRAKPEPGATVLQDGDAGGHAPSLFRETRCQPGGGLGGLGGLARGAAAFALCRPPVLLLGLSPGLGSPGTSWDLPQVPGRCGPGHSAEGRGWRPARALPGPAPAPVWLGRFVAPRQQASRAQHPDTPIMVRFLLRGHTVSTSRDEARANQTCCPRPPARLRGPGVCQVSPRQAALVSASSWKTLPKAPSAPSEGRVCGGDSRRPVSGGTGAS